MGILFSDNFFHIRQVDFFFYLNFLASVFQSRFKIISASCFFNENSVNCLRTGPANLVRLTF